MLRCRKCTFPLDEGTIVPERCPNCGTPTRAPEPEAPMSVALGTVWRRGAGGDAAAAVPEDRSQGGRADGASKEPAVPEDSRGAGPEAVPGDRSAVTSLPLGAVPGAARPARRSTGFYPAVPDVPAPAVPTFLPPGRAGKDGREGAGAEVAGAAVSGDRRESTGPEDGRAEVAGAAVSGDRREGAEGSGALSEATSDAIARAFLAAVELPAAEPGEEVVAEVVAPPPAPAVPRARFEPAPAGEPDDLPTPVASSRPFTLPKLTKRITVPAATAATNELETSAELDLPQLAALSQPALETVVAPPRAPGPTRPDDVDLDLEDLHSEAASEPPPEPAPASVPGSTSASGVRDHLRAPPPRPRRVPVLPPTSGPREAGAGVYLTLVALGAALIGLWWFYFDRGRAAPTPAVVGDLSPGTWPESYVREQAQRLDADRAPEYLAALAEAEAQGDRLGRAEAALCMHLRYGPDLVRRSAAEVWRTQAARGDPREARVAGLAALATGEVEEAERLLGGAGEDARAHLYRALAAQQRDDHETAARAAAEALALRPNDAAAALVAATATLAARRDAPLTGLQAAVEAHPEHPLYQQALLRALIERGRLAQARALAGTLTRVEGASEAHQARVLLLKAEVAAATGEGSLALYDALEAGRLAPQDLAIQLARVRLWLASGDLGRAQQEITPWTRGAAADPEALALQAELAIQAGNESVATRALDRLAAVDRRRGRVALLRGRVHALRGRNDEAAAAFAAALAHDPGDVAAAIALAELRVRSGAAEPLAPLLRAEEVLRADPRAARRPGLRALALARANLLVETGRKDQAVAVLDAALAADPDDNAAQLRRGVLAVEQGRTAAGRADLTAVFERTGGFPGLVGPLGRLYLRDGDLAGLAALIQPQTTEQRLPDDVVLMRALLRLAQGDRDAADEAIDRVLQRSPGSWEAHLAKARVLYERDRIPEALAEIRQARPRNPDAEVELWTGKIAERGGRLQDAAAAFRRARQLDPSLLEAAFLHGRALLAQGLAREAVAELQAVTRVTDAIPAAHFSLGLALREREQLPEALQSFLRAADHDPSPGEALYWAGRTAAEIGQPADAAQHLGRAVALGSPGTPWLAEAQLWLGRSLHRQARRAEARASLTAYLQLAGPRAPARAEVERLLRER